MAERTGAQQAEERDARRIGADTNRADISIGTALERLLTASQSVVTKRIDLALLEARDLVSRGLISIFLLGLNIVWIAAAWCALTICLIALVLRDGSFVAHVAAFGILNAAAALVGVLIIRRWAMLRREAD